MHNKMASLVDAVLTENEMRR